MLNLVALALGCFVAGALGGVGVASVIRRLRHAGLSRCVLCDGAGYYRDITIEHLQERAEREAARLADTM